MQIHIPDPAYTSSERAQANFRLAVKISLGFVALIWLIQLLNWGLDLGLERFGVRPLQLAGLLHEISGEGEVTQVVERTLSAARSLAKAP